MTKGYFYCRAFFGSLYRCLARGAKAVLQVYPKNLSQRQLIVSLAILLDEQANHPTESSLLPTFSAYSGQNYPQDIVKRWNVEEHFNPLLNGSSTQLTFIIYYNALLDNVVFRLQSITDNYSFCSTPNCTMSLHLEVRQI
ncbi:hypothetical protein Nepgr_028759 [Nepenthes gracilis]|uniref:Uncharacterized protein n=1 Tax=Nepenthes gracilis TaxID=150966 RepID=A0AAD3TDM9_NEPGR|nr:hypothetical protein Nepgr_028759 [Nepenthes gracilis]